jgi:hypothetical protein
MADMASLSEIDPPVNRARCPACWAKGGCSRCLGAGTTLRRSSASCTRRTKLLNEGQRGGGDPPPPGFRQTYHRWRNQFRVLKADDAERQRELEKENA